MKQYTNVPKGLWLYHRAAGILGALILLLWVTTAAGDMSSALPWLALALGFSGPLAISVWAYREIRRLKGKSRLRALWILTRIGGGSPLILYGSWFFDLREKWLQDLKANPLPDAAHPQSHEQHDEAWWS